jgi:hypothetical protein
MENRIMAFINKRVILYNNVRIPKPIYNELKNDIVLYLKQFLQSEFYEYLDDFVISDTLVINTNNQKLVKCYLEFYDIFINKILANKQTDVEIKKYGSHEDIFKAIIDTLDEVKYQIEF